MEPVTCNAVQEDLPRLANGSLTRGRRLALWAHWTECEACRAELAGWVLWRDALKHAGPTPDDRVLQDAWAVIQRRAGLSGVPDAPALNALGPPLDIVGPVLTVVRTRLGVKLA